MEKNKTDGSNTVIPDNAVKVWEDGNWVVLWSNSEKSFYFMSSARPSSVLRISTDKLLKFVREVETKPPASKNTDVMMQLIEEGIMSLSQRDKRQFRRFTKRCEATFTWRGISKRGIASDFSINGLFIKTSRPFSSDEVIDILVHLPDNSISSLQGKVTRTINNPFGNISGSVTKACRNGMGVKITKKDATYLHFIRSLVK